MTKSFVTGNNIKLNSELFLEKQAATIEALTKELERKNKLLNDALDILSAYSTVSVANQAAVVRVRKKLPVRPPNNKNISALLSIENGGKIKHELATTLYGINAVITLPSSLTRVIVMDMSVYGQAEIRILAYQSYSYEVVNHLRITKQFKKGEYQCESLKQTHMHHEEFDYLQVLTGMN